MSQVIEITEINNENIEEINNIIEEKRFIDRISQFVRPFIKNCKTWFINFINEYVINVYLETIFTVIFGTSILLLTIVLLSDLKPEIIPFAITSIKWSSAPHVARQLSIFFTFLSFITTNMLIMRTVLTISFGIGIIAIAISPPPLNFSFILWDFVILLINLKHVLLICYRKRHITFDKDRELVYTNIFNDIMSRHNFQELCTNSLIRVINPNRYYIKENESCNNLTILISGRMMKIDKKDTKTIVSELAYIDSPEFIMREENSGKTFNVSFYAETRCKILIWPRELVNTFLKQRQDLNILLLTTLGIDVAKKVFLLDTNTQ